MKIENVPIDSIKPYEKNPRRNDAAVQTVMISIQEFGFKVPIIVDKDNVIVCGHTRLKAAKTLGLKEVPIIKAEDLSPEQIKAFRIMDNKSSEAATWDKDLLQTELEELKGMDFDLDLTGFSEIEIDKVLSNDVQEAPIPEGVKYDIHIEDLYELDNGKGLKHYVYCGDATNKQDVDKLITNNQMHLLVTDPPYGVNYDPEWRDKADKSGLLGNKYPTRAMGKVSNDDKIDWSDAFKLFNGNVAYVWHAGKYTKQVQEGLENIGYEVINQIIWVKPHFILSRGDYHWKHEPCLYVVKKGEKHNFVGDRSQTTVWDIAGMNCFGGSNDKADKRTGHGTQKPIECMKRPIKNNSKKGENIYDCFGGSGSTLIACEQTGRNCYMMELDEDYTSKIIERWENLTGKVAKKLNKDGVYGESPVKTMQKEGTEAPETPEKGSNKDLPDY